MPCTQAPTAAQASEVANELLAAYYAGELDRMELEGYEIFKLTSKDGAMAVEKESIPVAEPKEFAPDMIFEQEPSQLLNAILPLYLNGQLLRTLQESVASELAARMS